MAMSLNEYIVSIINAPIEDADKAIAIVRAVVAAQKVTQSAVDATKVIDKAAAVPAPASVAPPPVAPAVIPAPVAVPAPVAAVTWTDGGGGRRYDDVVAPGTPGTQTCPLTGHVVSDPLIDRGESFVPYCGRVSKQCGSTMADFDRFSGALMMMGVDQHFAQFGGFKHDGSNWHLAADEVFNQPVYHPQDPAVLAAQQKAWDDAMKKMAAASQNPPPAEPPPTDVEIK